MISERGAEEREKETRLSNRQTDPERAANKGGRDRGSTRLSF